MKDLHATLALLKSSKFLIADRSNGYICPGSMQIVGFDDVLASGCVHYYTYNYNGIDQHCSYFRKGVYIANEDGTFRNVHRELRKLLIGGILEMVGDGYAKTLRIKTT